ncbi:hypothetical protein ACIBHX_34965 [Nonomuraea sp. NPDC050536]|uniref:hypothetical protein n=1 Tax=Nonomuraea sp. NPDC050536 TaxID=3364366 RepID=UPI0037CC44AB
MRSDRPRKEAAWPWLLFVLWIVGTPLLGYGFTVMGGEARDKQFAQICGDAVLIVGFGAPMLGLLLALLSRRRGATIVFGLALLAVAVLWVWLVLRK